MWRTEPRPCEPASYRSCICLACQPERCPIGRRATPIESTFIIQLPNDCHRDFDIPRTLPRSHSCIPLMPKRSVERSCSSRDYNALSSACATAGMLKVSSPSKVKVFHHSQRAKLKKESEERTISVSGGLCRADSQLPLSHHRSSVSGGLCRADNPVTTLYPRLRLHQKAQQHQDPVAVIHRCDPVQPSKGVMCQSFSAHASQQAPLSGLACIVTFCAL